MTKALIVVMIMVCGIATAKPYFGAYEEQVHFSLHPARNYLEDTLKAIGTALAGSPNWTGTAQQAHNLVRRTVILKHNISVPVSSDLDAAPTKSDHVATSLRTSLLEQGYDEAEVDLLIIEFSKMTHPAE